MFLNFSHWRKISYFSGFFYDPEISGSFKSAIPKLNAIIRFQNLPLKKVPLFSRICPDPPGSRKWVVNDLAWGSFRFFWTPSAWALISLTSLKMCLTCVGANVGEPHVKTIIPRSPSTYEADIKNIMGLVATPRTKSELSPALQWAVRHIDTPVHPQWAILDATGA